MENPIDKSKGEYLDELNILKEQINLLAQQNINLCRELANQHFLLSQAIDAVNQKIDVILNGSNRFYLNQAAGMQTADFIIKNMNKVKFFDYGIANVIGVEYYQYILSQAENDGLFLEFGVFQGTTINMISAIKPDKTIFGFDSFEGLPEDWRSNFGKGTFNVQGNLPKVNPNVQLIKGWFNETLPPFVKNNRQKCSFIHVDCDLYSSTKTIFAELKNQIGAGTVIAFDEYFNYPGWQEGEYKAFKEFAAENNLNFEYIAYTGREQVAVKIK